MHDPMVVAFEIRRPWPQRHRSGDARGPRWKLRGAFWKIAGREIYWPPLITVWHVEPGGHDSLTVCDWRTSRWQWHVHHWRPQFHPVQHLRRRLLTRCEWCGGTSRKGDYVNVSLGWDRERGPWWRGENGLFHGDCTSAYGAHRACVCDEPAPERESHGDCAHCGRFVPFGRKPAAVEANRVFQRLAPGERPTPEMLDYVREIYRQERESARREPSA